MNTSRTYAALPPTLWDYISEVTERNQGLLMGQTREMRFAD
jgi:hypothetical protein